LLNILGSRIDLSKGCVQTGSIYCNGR